MVNKMEAIKLEPSDESEQIALSHPYESKQTIDQLRMTFKAAIQRIEVHVKSDSNRKPAKRQLTEEELEARRRINRIRMAATRAARTLEQIEADRMSQRARMAALRRRRSEQELKSVLGEQGTQGDVDVVEVSRSNISIEPRVRRNSSSRRQLTPEELEIRRRINRLRVAMMRAERTEEQIEADRKAQRLRMAELRRRRSEEQIAADLESQRARMAALRRERRSRLREEGPTSASELCRPIVKQELEEEQPGHQQTFPPVYPDSSQSVQATVVGAPLGSVDEWERKRLAAERRRQWRVKLSPEEIEERKRKAAERMRIYRATLRATLSPQELQERKWKAAERMRQWRASLTPEELARMRAKGLERARRWRSQRGGRAHKGSSEDVSSQPAESQSCSPPEGGATLRWEKTASCPTTQDQGGGRQCASFKDCVVSPYFSVPTSRDCENGCSTGHWASSGAPSSMVDPYVNGSVPVSLSPRSPPPPPPPHFLPHHLQHHHPVGVLPDVSSAVVSSEGGGSSGSTLGDSAQSQQPPPPLLHHMPCLQPPHAAPLPSGLAPPFAPRTSLACDWPQPRHHLMGYEGFSTPLHSSAISANRPLEES